MNLFDKAKKDGIKSSNKFCAWCKNSFQPDPRNEKRGWAKCCSKSCAVSLRNHLNQMPHNERMTEIRDIKLRELGL